MGFVFNNNITCKKCGKKADISTMQLDRYGEMMLCPDCSAGQFKRKGERKVMKDGSVMETRPERGSLSYSNEFGLTTKREREIFSQNAPQEMYAYKCTNCQYEFKRRKAFPFTGKCPYCGKDKVAFDPIKSGQWVEKLW